MHRIREINPKSTLFDSETQSINFVATMSFGQNLRLWRERLGLTLDDVSEKSGIATSTISQIETEKQRPHNSTRRVLAAALGLQPQDLAEAPSKGAQRPSVDDLFEGIGRAYFDGELTMEDILDRMMKIREEEKKRGLK